MRWDPIQLLFVQALATRIGQVGPGRLGPSTGPVRAEWGLHWDSIRAEWGWGGVGHALGFN